MGYFRILGIWSATKGAAGNGAPEQPSPRSPPPSPPEEKESMGSFGDVAVQAKVVEEAKELIARPPTENLIGLRLAGRLEKVNSLAELQRLWDR